LPTVDPIRTYYLPFNILVDSTGQLFYFQLPYYHFQCGTGLDWDTPPEFLNLKPKDLIKLPDQNVDVFIKQNLELMEEGGRRICIASLKDTFQSEGLHKAFKILKDSTLHANWILIKATQEERTVLDYKVRQAFYDPESIQYDSTQIHKPKIINFTIPKIID